MKIERLIKELYELGIRRHVYIEDSWYSCPKGAAENEPSPGGSFGPDFCSGDCNCGADSNNEKLRAIYVECRNLIARGI